MEYDFSSYFKVKVKAGLYIYVLLTRATMKCVVMEKIHLTGAFPEPCKMQCSSFWFFTVFGYL